MAYWRNYQFSLFIIHLKRLSQKSKNWKKVIQSEAKNPVPMLLPDYSLRSEWLFCWLLRQPLPSPGSQKELLTVESISVLNLFQIILKSFSWKSPVTDYFCIAEFFEVAGIQFSMVNGVYSGQSITGIPAKVYHLT